MARGRAALRGWGPAAAGEGLLGSSLKQAVPLLASLVNFKATAELLHSCPGRQTNADYIILTTPCV